MLQLLSIAGGFNVTRAARRREGLLSRRWKALNIGGSKGTPILWHTESGPVNAQHQSRNNIFLRAICLVTTLVVAPVAQAAPNDLNGITRPHARHNQAVLNWRHVQPRPQDTPSGRPTEQDQQDTRSLEQLYEHLMRDDSGSPASQHE
jgi:hypothetical protein